MKTFREIIKDMKSGDAMLQNAAMLRLYRMGDAKFKQFTETVSTEEFESVAADMLEILKSVVNMDKSQEGIESIFEDRNHKKAPEIVADWKSGDIRIRLAILAQLKSLSPEAHSHIMKLANEDPSPIIKLEAENVELDTTSEETAYNDDKIAADTEEIIDQLKASSRDRTTGKKIEEKSILIVEDSGYIRLFFQQLFKNVKVFDAASSLEEAKRLLKSKQYDLIFLDISLPDGDGLEYLAWLRDGVYDGIVIMLSAYSSPELVRSAFSLGADDYLIKPIQRSLPEFLDYVDKL